MPHPRCSRSPFCHCRIRPWLFVSWLMPDRRWSALPSAGWICLCRPRVISISESLRFPPGGVSPHFRCRSALWIQLFGGTRRPVTITSMPGGLAPGCSPRRQCRSRRGRERVEFIENHHEYRGSGQWLLAMAQPRWLPVCRSGLARCGEESPAGAHLINQVGIPAAGGFESGVFVVSRPAFKKREQQRASASARDSAQTIVRRHHPEAALDSSLSFSS